MLLGCVPSLSQIATAAEALLLVIFCWSETLVVAREREKRDGQKKRTNLRVCA